MIRVAALMFIAFTLALRGPFVAQAGEFHTLDQDQKNVVEFTSEATMEKIVGRTSSVTGSVNLNLAELTATSGGSFTVDLNTLDTGLSLRNQHMRENHLETKLYPQATFTLKRLESPSAATLGFGGEVTVTAVGDFALHGITKEYMIPVTLRYLAAGGEAEKRLSGGQGNLLYVTANWTVKLEDHQIKRPEFLFLRLSPEQKIEISVALTDQ
ncbi:YceI family protein [candidate division KSB1 bacterium]|nr:YceI family protein [candidate division KSB1 bacterium]